MTRGKRKKFITIILTFAMVVSFAPAVTLSAWADPTASDTWDGSVASAFAEGDGTQDRPYKIATAEQLAYMAGLLNNTSTYVMYKDRYYELTVDLDLGNYPWTPIASSNAVPFCGSFDGCEHIITFGNSTDAVNTAGLFGYIDSTGTVKNIKINGNVENSGAGDVYAGLIAAWSCGTISNCSVEGTLTGTATASDSKNSGIYLGGIAATNFGSIEGCSAKCTIEGTVSTGSKQPYAYLGGIAAICSGGNLENCSSECTVTGSAESESCPTKGYLYIGGLLGASRDEGYKVRHSTISNCTADCITTGTITSNSSMLASGYVGGLIGVGDYKSSIKNCHSTGNVESTAAVTDASSPNPQVYAGGLIGLVQYLSTIEDCSSSCSVTAGPLLGSNDVKTYAGGLAGYNYFSTIQNSYSEGDVSGSGINLYIGGLAGMNRCYNSSTNSYVTDCYARGDVSGSATNKLYLGSLLGYNYGAASNCYATGKVSESGSGTNCIGGFAGYNDSTATISNGYFDKETTGRTEGVGANGNTASDAVSTIGLTTLEMTGTAAESGMLLDFGSKWKTQENAFKSWYYPQFQSASGFDSAALPIAITEFKDLDASIKTQNIKESSAISSVVQPSTVGAILNALYSVDVPVNNWSSNMVFPAQVGTYTFTPSINDYTIASDVSLPQITVQVSSVSSSHRSSGSSPSSDNSSVLVNDKTQTAGIVKTTVSGSVTTTTVTLTSDEIKHILNGAGSGSTVTIPITTDPDVATGQLDGQAVKNMEEKDAVIVVNTGVASYTLPATEINIDAISEQFGKSIALDDITVNVSISEPSDATVKIVENTAEKGGFSIVVPAVDFTINCEYNGTTTDVSSFNAYVERLISIPDGVDPEKITTGVVVKPDGTTYHVPTRVVKIDGKYYAKINSLTNSTYTVVWHPIEFSDVAKHWAKDAINDMGSRMVVNGDENGNYNPNNNITRAEFAAIIVRALGLAPATSDGSFSDVKSASWYCGYVQTAASYGIIEGYSTSTFGPKDAITREQAMAMMARAMKTTGLEPGLTDSEISSLLGAYTDGTSASNYAKGSIAACLKTGIVSGMGGSIIAPKNSVTRAEVAVMVQRLLQKSKLI